MIRIKKVDNRELNILEKIYIIEIFKGFMVTFKHLFRNLFHPSKIITISYPEERIPIEGNAGKRTMHRIKIRADGTPKCVACMLCATICPAKCIHIEAGESDKKIEKYPEIFDIDISRCIMCGLCVEACPEDAIAMDTGVFPSGAYDRYKNIKRDGLYMTKEELFRNLIGESPSRKGAANRLANEEFDLEKNK